jgi:hypothetical protein
MRSITLSMQGQVEEYLNGKHGAWANLGRNALCKMSLAIRTPRVGLSSGLVGSVLELKTSVAQYSCKDWSTPQGGDQGEER